MTRRNGFVLGSRAAANAATAKAVAAVAEGSPPATLHPRAEIDLAARTPPSAPARLHGARGDAEFLPSALLAVDEPPSPMRKRVACILAALLLSTAAWSCFGRLASYATAAGKVQAIGRTKVLEAQQSGQVTGILARDGDRVAAGDVMVTLDPTDAVAARNIIVDKLADLRGQNARRRAEIAAAHADPVPTDARVAWDATVPQRVRDRESDVLRADLARLSGSLATLASRRAAAVVRRDMFSSMIEAQNALVAVTQENSSMADQLERSGWNSRAKALDLIESVRSQQVTLTSFKGQMADAEAELATLDNEAIKTRESFASGATNAAAQAEQQITDLEQRSIKADNVLAQMTLRAPVSGVVHASALTTLGQFVTPSQQLMQIVPAEAPVEIVAYVENTDVGLIRQGQDATVKVDAFNYATFGTVDGTVAAVGSDALPVTGKSTLQGASLDGTYGQSTAAQRTGDLKYPVAIRLKDPSISIGGKPVPLTAGMSVSVEIETESRRVIDYVTSPLLDMLSTAAHER